MWIVIYHFRTELWLLFPSLLHIKPLMTAGYLAVPFFFILSGYVIGLNYQDRFCTLSTKNVARFLFLRLGRIYPVHFVTLLVCVGIVALDGWPTEPVATFNFFLANLTLTHAWASRLEHSWNYPSWSISSEWFMYLLCPWLLYRFSRMSKTAICRGLAAAILISLVIAFVFDTLPFNTVLLILPTFVGGVFLAHLFPPNSESSPLQALALPLLICIAILPFLIPLETFRNCLMVLGFFALIPLVGSFRARPTVYLGKISYSLYMTHAIVIVLLGRLFPFRNIATTPLLNRIWVATLCFAVIASAALLMYYLVEEPARKWSRRKAFENEIPGPSPLVQSASSCT